MDDKAYKSLLPPPNRKPTASTKQASYSLHQTHTKGLGKAQSSVAHQEAPIVRNAALALTLQMCLLSSLLTYMEVHNTALVKCEG